MMNKKDKKYTLNNLQQLLVLGLFLMPFIQITAQPVFTEVAGTPFTGVSYSAIAFADVDGDGDQDVLITGLDGSSPIAKLYTNNGTGTFTEVVGTPFTGVSFSSVAFADVDGDGDQDVLITGNTTAKLYTNNGTGTFTQVVGTPFTGVYYSSVTFKDVDGDGDQDVLITGSDGGGNKTAKLYTNNGTGTFTEVVGTPFTGVENGTIAFADVDGDGDQDVLITGQDGSSNKTAKLYTNSGTGTFTEVVGTPFTGVYLGSIAFADVDGDGDQDLMITGLASGLTAKLYTNNGTGTFTEVTGTPFTAVYDSSIAFADVDGDGDQDLLITGRTGSRIAKLYTNNGTGTFTELAGTPFLGVDRSSVAFADVDGDGDQDLMITGRDASSNQTSKLYTACITTTSTDVQTACDTYTWIDGNNYTASNNTATQTLTNANGCDSVVTLDLTINSSSTGTDTQTVCDSLTWLDGMTYYANNNTAMHTIVGGNANGCDSVVTLNLTINNSGVGIDVQAACDSYTWIDGNSYTVSNNTATHIITNGSANGCDSTVNLNLVINNSTTSTDIQAACDTYDWIDGMTYTSDNNTATVTLTNAAGCDSTVTLNLTITTIDNSVTVLGADSALSANEVSAGATYQWIDCDNGNTIVAGETNQVFVATNPGNYAVEVTLNGCVDSSSCEFAVNVDEVTSTSTFSIYPNPVRETLMISATETISSISIFGVNGQLVQTIAHPKNARLPAGTEVNVSNLVKGMYIIEAQTNKGVVQMKFVKE